MSSSFGALFFSGTSLLPTILQFPVILTVLLIAPKVILDAGTRLIDEDYASNIDSILNTESKTYDFIIVGAGSAGAVLLNRLTAPPNNFSVLVLEAGGDPIFVTRPPMFNFFVSHHNTTDWMYKSTPQKRSCLSCTNRSYAYPRGKSLGGCSTLNWMIYIRGNQKNFDSWAADTGDDQWNYNNLKDYFKRSENYIGSYPNYDIHGCGGELFVDKITYETESHRYFIKALKESRHYHEEDVNLNQTNAFMKLDTTTNRGLRWSTYDAFIKPVINRTNLHIHRYSNVAELIFDPVDKVKVVGVKYHRQNVTKAKYAYARREVIVSAGAINTAQILMISGIGPREHLESLNIPVVKDLPVGKNLMDHPTVLLPIIFNRRHTSMIFERDVMVDMVEQYEPIARVGPMSSPNVFATGYFSSPYNDDVNFPDIQHTLSYIGLSIYFPQIFGPFMNIHRDVLQSFLRGYIGRDGNMALSTLVRPRSVGNVTLNKSDIYSKPIIEPNYFSDSNNYDFESLVSGIMDLVAFYEGSPSYAELGAQLLPRPLPACRQHRFRTREYFRCYAAHFTMTLWHFTSTCKMGRVGDPNAVTDSRLRVQGIKNLRIVDASIMPTITNGNTNAPVIMIGEKGADIILEDHGGVKIPLGSQKACPYIITTFPKSEVQN